MTGKSELSEGCDVVLIDLPLPTRALSPNGRAGWRRKAKAVARYRDAAYLVAKQAQKGVWRRWRHAVARVTFYWPDNRRRDEDNAVASLKPAFDGLVDAALLVDDSTRELRREPPAHCVDARNPRVIIEVTEAAEPPWVLPGPRTPGRPREQSQK